MPWQVLATAGAGVVFGFALAAPPGPMNAVIAEESVLRGWWAGVRTGLGAFVADAAFFALSLVGVVTVVRELPWLRGVMTLAGGCLMVYFAAGAARQASAAVGHPAAPEGEGTGFRKALALGLTNPYQIAFWLTVGVGLLEPGTVDVLAALPVTGDALADALVVRTGSAALVGGLFAGIGVWVLVFPAALVWAGRRLDAVTPAIAVGSALVLALFGVAFLVDGAGTLLA